MLELRKRVLNSLNERRQRVIDKKINSIPSPFKRFSNDFIGIEQGKYYILTGGTKSAKTQLSSYLFLYNSLFYAYEHPEQIRLKIFYYNLEESQEDIFKRFMCYLLYTKTHYKIHISPLELSSTKSSLDESILNLFEEEEYQDILKFFESTIIFSDATNPTGIYKECMHYAVNNGITYKKKKTIKDEFGQTTEIDVFDYYIPNDIEEYKLIFVDHISLLNTERGLTLKESIDRLSGYCVLLRNRYKFTPIIVQQQALAQEGLDAIKAGRMRPTLANLSDSKFCSRDANVVLGIFSPYRFELPEYAGYDIKILKDKIRFLEVLVNRGGSPGGMVALYFDGAVNYFTELPHPQKQEVELNKIYNKLSKTQITLFMSTSSTYLIGSHNSWSYVTPKNKWLKPFHFTTRCQSKSITKQYIDYDARIFDLRVRYHHEYWYCAHGSMIFDKKAYEALEDLLEIQGLDNTEKCYIRIVLEYKNRPKEAIVSKFLSFCSNIEDIYGKYFNFFGGRLKGTWEELYHFDNDIELDDKYSSTTTLFNVSTDTKIGAFLKIIDDWIPWLYAKLNNRRLYATGTTKDCLFLDFINIK